MIVVDAHQDIAYNALSFGRDYLKSALEKRQLEQNTDVPEKNGLATCGLPDALLGRVAVIFATLFVAPARANDPSWDVLTYQTPREAYELGIKQYDHYQRLLDRSDKLRLITHKKDLESVLETWSPDKDIADHKQGFVLLMENGDPILEPRQFEEWYARGVRVVGPAWKASRYCGGTGEPGGLTSLGRELLEVLASFNTLLDLSHMAEQSFLESVDRYDGHLIASHSNPRKFRNTDRHLTDDMIRRLAERDGVMGVVIYNSFLSDNWSKGMRKEAITFDRVLDVIDYYCQLTGSSAHVGIGTDFDGGFGVKSIPEGFDTIMDILTIGDGLRARGYAENDIEAILSGNMLRKLRAVLPD